MHTDKGQGLFVLIVFLIAVTNLGLGYALAIYHEGRWAGTLPLTWLPAWPGLRELVPRSRWERSDIGDSLFDDPLLDLPSPAESPPLPTGELTSVAADPPPPDGEQSEQTEHAEHGEDGEDGDQTERQAETVESAASEILEALQVLRETLVESDWRIRQADESVTVEQLTATVDELKHSCSEYLLQSARSSAELASQEQNAGDSPLGACMSRYGQSLQKEANQIETVLLEFDSLDLQQEVETRCAKFLAGCELLHDTTWLLHDGSHMALAGVLRSSGHLASLGEELPVDPVTGLPDAVTIESHLKHLRGDDTDEVRIISLGVIDPCQIRPIGAQHGLRMADDIMRETGRLLSQLARTGEDDLVARLDTHRLAVLFVDSGPRNSSCVIERVRQTLERTWFEFADRRVQTLLSIGVTDLRPDDNFDSLVARATACVEAAKAAGGNGTFLDDGRGPMVVKPPEFEIETHVQRLQL